MKYDPATATFEDDGGPSFDPKPSDAAAEPHPHEVHRLENEGGITLELVDRFAQVQGD